MLADPLVVVGDWTTITADSGEDLSFPASERAADHSTYKFADVDEDGRPVTWTMFVGHQYGKRSRYTIRLTVDSVLPDLLSPANNAKVQQSVYVVADVPNTGVFEPYSEAPAIPTFNKMMHMIGGFLVSVDTAVPVFRRVVDGET
jgi:hypothetical protein